MVIVLAEPEGLEDCLEDLEEFEDLEDIDVSEHLEDLEDLIAEVDLWREARERVVARHPGFLEKTQDTKLAIQRVANEVIGTCIQDLVEHTRARLEEASPSTSGEARAHASRLVGHSESLKPQVAQLRSFLYKRFYRHEHLQRFLDYAREVLGALFEAYRSDPGELPAWYQQWAAEVGLERAIGDYLAGMTDRFAQQECARLVSPALARFPASSES